MLLLQCPDVCSNIVTFYWRFIISVQSTVHFTLEQRQVYYQSQSMHLEHQHTTSRDPGHISSTATGQLSIWRFVHRLPHSLLWRVPTTPQMLASLNPQIKARYSATSPLLSYLGRMGRHCSVLCVHAQHSHRPNGSIDTNLSPELGSTLPPACINVYCSALRVHYSSHVFLDVSAIDDHELRAPLKV